MGIVWEGYRLGGRYEIQEILGEGGMSAVYKAFDHNLKRTVAVKIIHPHLANDEDFVRRFETEAQAIAQLHHPHIVQVYDFATEGELHYMVLEYIPGETLQTLLERLRQQGRRLPLDEALRLMVQISDAVAYAHQQGMIHRDLKPANILLRPSGEPMLTDFGLARLIDSSRRTRSGMVMGTVLYMAPEQVLGEKVDHRADLYALGVMLFELLTGRLPFAGETLAEIMQQHLHAAIPDPREIVPDLPPALSAIVQRALAKAPEARYPSAEALQRALTQVLAETTGQEAAPAEAQHTVVETRPAESRPGTVVEVPAQRPATVSPTLAEQGSHPPPPPAVAPKPMGSSPRVAQVSPSPAPARRAKPTLLHMAALESAMLAGLFGGAAYLLSRVEVLWLAAAWWLLALGLLLRALPEWWRLSAAYRLILVRNEDLPAQDGRQAPGRLPFRFQVPRLDFPNDMVLMLFPAALAAVLTTGVGLAAVFGVATTPLAAVWLAFALPVWLFHLRFLALNFLQPGVLERIHFGHFLLALSLGVLAVPAMAFAWQVPTTWRSGILLLGLGAFGVGGMLGSLTLIFLLRRALSTGLPRPALAPLVFFIGPLVAVYTIFALLLMIYLNLFGVDIPEVVFSLVVLMAWGIALAGEVLAVMVYQGYRYTGVPLNALRWGLVDAFVGPGLLGIASWGAGMRGWPVRAVTVGGAVLGALLFLKIAWAYYQRQRHAG